MPGRGTLLRIVGVRIPRFGASRRALESVAEQRVAAHDLGLQQYSREAVHGAALTAETVHAISQAWLAQTADEIAEQPLMHPLRAAVIGGGSMILDEIVTRVPGQQVLVSETDILDGIAHELLAR